MTLTQAILPVAGYGTRFLPWTKVVPKELLPIGNKPIIAHLVDECMSCGIKEICFVISKGKEAIPQFFATDSRLEKVLEERGKLHLLAELTRYHEVKFHVVYQEKMLGDGHAILQAKRWVTSEEIAVLFGDDLIQSKESGLEQLANAYAKLTSSKEKAILCLQNVDRALVSKYGVVDPEPHQNSRLKKIRGLVEKPKPESAPSTLGIVGKYIIPTSTLDALASVQSGTKDHEIRLIDALRSQLESGAIDIFGYEFEGKRFDTGTPEGYKEAVMAIG